MFADAKNELAELDGSKGTSEADYLAKRANKYEQRLRLLEETVDADDMAQSVSDMINKVNNTIDDLRQEMTFGSPAARERLAELEDLKGFLMNFKDPKVLSDYPEDNLSFKSWLEDGGDLG